MAHEEGKLTSVGVRAEPCPAAGVFSPSARGAVASVLGLQRTRGNRYVQRMFARAGGAVRDGEEAPAEVQAGIRRARGGGRPLEAGVRARMESAFGQDLGGVRLHTDERADALNRALNSLAFTAGQDIFFRGGAYDPHSRDGLHTLSHELTHVVQQSGAGSTEAAPLQVGEADGPLESEADRVAHDVARGLAAQAPSRADSAPGLQKKGLSWELQDAPPAETPELRVLLWLGKYKHLFAEAEARFRIDRRAIAGAIAWEALENPSKLGFSFRAVGPGKPHLWDVNFSPRIVPNVLGSTLSLADIKLDMPVKQVEDLGYLPQKSYEERRELLKSPAGSIQYIGAIMAAIADTAAPVEDIRCQPALLADVYQWIDFDKWQERIRRRLESKRASGTYAPFAVGNRMGFWLQAHLDYVETAVGKPACPLKAPEGAAGKAERK